MQIEIKRYSESKAFNGSTQGLLYIDGKFEAHTLEDEARDIKIMAETRIPAGNYSTMLADWGSIHSLYEKRWPGIHQGMIMLLGVPGFEGILFHCGASEADTAGCILIGDGIGNNQYSCARLSDSWEAYLRVYKKALPAVLKNDLKVSVYDL